MITWNNLDTLEAFKNLSKAERVNIAEAMSGENGAERVKTYSTPMAEGLAYNYAAKHSQPFDHTATRIARREDHT